MLLTSTIFGLEPKNILRQHGYHFYPIYHLPSDKRKEAVVPATAAKKLNASLQVYLNPTNGQFNFQWNPQHENTTTAQLEIRSLAGHLIWSQNISTTDGETHHSVNSTL